MAGSVNKVILVGNLGRDPEIRQLNDNGKRVCNFPMATEESWRDRQTGEKRSRTEWHRIVVFNEGLIKVLEQYVKKGTKVYIEGSLQTRQWTDNNNTQRYSTEIVLQPFSGVMTILSSAQGRDGASNGNGNGANAGSAQRNGGQNSGRPAQAASQAPAGAQSQAPAGDEPPAWGDNNYGGNLDDEIPF